MFFIHSPSISSLSSLRLGCFVGGLLLASQVACSGPNGSGNPSDSASGSGGSWGTGGSSSAGGHSGGVTTSGGAPASGGTSDVDGSGGTGGTSLGTGGSLATGGEGTGGDSSSGGADAGGGASSGGGVGTGGLGSGGSQLGTGGDGAGGTGGEPGFEPCPAAEPCKILPLGDSITFGLGFDGGYRVELFRLALNNGHDVTFTGTQSPNGPMMVEGVTFPRNHGGISGETIQQIADRIPQPELTEMPHIILVHAGTNDMVQSPDGATDRLGALMDELIAEAPDALIVVSNIIPLSFSDVSAFNEPIPSMVEQRAEEGAHIIFVDQFEGFPMSELGDGVHPNEAGYARMAGKWFEAIEGYLR